MRADSANRAAILLGAAPKSVELFLQGNYIPSVTWAVRFCDEFDGEFKDLAEDVQDELLAVLKLLAAVGPTLGRPRVDRLNGSKHANMKELRFDAGGGVWRVAFAFDSERRAIVLMAGNKSGLSPGGEKKFYKELIRKADDRFDRHVEGLRKQKQSR